MSTNEGPLYVEDAQAINFYQPYLLFRRQPPHGPLLKSTPSQPSAAPFSTGIYNTFLHAKLWIMVGSDFMNVTRVVILDLWPGLASHRRHFS
jgi:hypothetical protein